jgi:TatD DNase family protein
MEDAAAWGEIGLDYHYMHSPADVQRRVFARQLRLARKHGRPVVIHTRDADDDTIAILEQEGAPESGGVIHCFTGGGRLAGSALAMGLHLSFSGIVSFKNAAPLREIARATPEDRLLVETDSPYLAPIPHRGKRNEPAFVRRVAEVLATERGATVDAVASATSANATRLFHLD